MHSPAGGRPLAVWYDGSTDDGVAWNWLVTLAVDLYTFKSP